ncbi:MAG: hypothetical protein A2X94_16750 [Bdellovibrionales bacterium GWB1_55_8]|nr:MAG: hypothetical protein A2X94_16750 [Bdellovibrionales bacterium GWB1_55_8]
MFRTALAGAGILVALFPDVSGASVSLKNGNFFISFVDIVYQGGFEPKIDRVYNSKSPYKGIFGHGWGTEYEAYLSVSADGSVVAHEYGGGAENRFVPVSFKQQELDKAVDAIAEAARKAGGLGSSQQLAEYKKNLKTNASFRNDEWEKYRKVLPPRRLPNGMQLHSTRFSYQYITKMADGYMRSYDSGKVEKYNEAGKLVRISDKNNNFIDLGYGKDGHLEKIVDNFNRKMFFHFNSQGLLEKISGENGKVASYQYNPSGELIGSKDVDGNAFTFKYDSANRHNMVEIGYSDKTSMKMTYYGREKNENVKSVKDRDGTTTEYGYVLERLAQGQHSVSVKILGSDGKPISNSVYEYTSKRKANGEEWPYKLVTNLDGERTETVYHEASGLPLSIKKNGEETAFEYDRRGHVTKKTTPSEITELSYDPKVNKINRVVKYALPGKKQSSWSTFQYDGKGNLVLAKNSDGKGVKLLYDNNGRILTLVDQDKRRIDFKYNENSKPIEITDPKLGTITVSYTNSGEIKKVESSAGRKIALQVTSAFQNLLDIIRPAGVNLSF